MKSLILTLVLAASFYTGMLLERSNGNTSKADYAALSALVAVGECESLLDECIILATEVVDEVIGCREKLEELQ
jgi:hypothetical protein